MHPIESVLLIAHNWNFQMYHGCLSILLLDDGSLPTVHTDLTTARAKKCPYCEI